MDNHVGYIPSTRVYYFENWDDLDENQIPKEDRHNCVVFIGKMSKGMLELMADESKIKLLK